MTSPYYYIKIHLVKAMVFPVVIYGCESWIIKKADFLSDMAKPILYIYIYIYKEIHNKNKES